MLWDAEKEEKEPHWCFNEMMRCFNGREREMLSIFWTLEKMKEEEGRSDTEYERKVSGDASPNHPHMLE